METFHISHVEVWIVFSGANKIQPSLLDLLQQLSLHSVLAAPVSVGLANFPIYYRQLVSGAIRSPIALEIVIEIERYLLYCLFLAVEERKLSVASFAFRLILQDCLLPGEIYVDGLENTERSALPNIILDDVTE